MSKCLETPSIKARFSSRRYSRQDIKEFWSSGHCNLDVDRALKKLRYDHEEDKEWKVEMDVLVRAEELGLDLEDLDDEDFR